MRTFPSTELKQNVGDVLSAASSGPVVITRNHKPRFVLMSVEEYERREHGRDPRQVFAVEETPDELNDLLAGALDRQIDELDHG